LAQEVFQLTHLFDVVLHPGAQDPELMAALRQYIIGRRDHHPCRSYYGL
jgi:hypothetical protein